MAILIAILIMSQLTIPYLTKFFNGSLNSRMDDLTFIFKNDSVANYKIWDEPWPENLPVVNYLSTYLQNKLTENMIGTRKPMAFSLVLLSS